MFQDLMKVLAGWAIGSVLLGLLVGRILRALGEGVPTAGADDRRGES